LIAINNNFIKLLFGVFMNNIYKLNFGFGRRAKDIVLLAIAAVIMSLGYIITASSATKSFAYVSNLDGSKVFVIDLSTDSITNIINIYTPTGGMDPLINDIRIYKNKAFLSVPGDMMSTLINKVKIIDTDLNTVVDSVSTDNAPTGIAIYNGKVYVLNRFTGTIHEIDPVTNTIVRTIPYSSSYSNPPIYLEITNDKIYLPFPGSGGTAGGVEVLDLTTGTKIKSIGFDSVDNYGPIGIKKIGANKIYVGGHQDVGVIDVASDSLVKKIRIKSETAGFIYAFTTIGNKVYSANEEGTCSVIDASADTLLKEIIVGFCYSCAYSIVDIAALGSRVYMTIPTQGVKVIDALTNELIDSISTPDYVGALDILEQRSINLLSVNDVPNDQGKQVQVIWQRFGGEDDNSHPVKQYGVWRMDNSPISKTMPTPNSFEEIGNSFKGIKVGDRFRIAGEVWTFVGWTPVSGLEKYSLIVPTLFDSTITSGMYLSKFMVSGHSSDFTLQVWSNVDSGYSIDNLVPHAPLAFEAMVVPSTVQLTWEPPSDPDVNYYAIYRGTTEGFDFEHRPPIATTTATSFNDLDVNNGTHYYYVARAIDFSGNKGLTANTSVLFTGLRNDRELPQEFALHQNYPNPFNPSTVIRYELPVESKVTLRVYNLLGQIVVTLADGIEQAGYGAIEWNTSNLTSGLYYYRFDAVSVNDPSNNFSQMRRMILLK
jgi:hypothetical protein